LGGRGTFDIFESLNKHIKTHGLHLPFPKPDTNQTLKHKANQINQFKKKLEMN
jgi:hypothetical protein